MSDDVITQEEAPATDELRAEVLAALQAELGEALLESYIEPGVDLWIRVDLAAWRRAGEVARDKVGCTFFSFLSAIDWMISPWGRSENTEFDPVTKEPAADAAAASGYVTGYAGGTSRFQLLARVESPTRHFGVTLKADLDEAAPVADSWVPVYAGANWHEREAWEMFGIDFTGHPYLRYLYLPGGFEGHPLRKDFPLLSREVKPWPGVVDIEQFPPGFEEPEAASEGGAAGEGAAASEGEAEAAGTEGEGSDA